MMKFEIREYSSNITDDLIYNLLLEMRLLNQNLAGLRSLSDGVFQPVDCAGLPVGDPQHVTKTVQLNKSIVQICNVAELGAAIAAALVAPVVAVPPVMTRVYYGFGNAAPLTSAQILASPHFIDVAHNSDYSIDFTPNRVAAICWFAELSTETAKTAVYMTPLNSFNIAVDQLIEGWSTVDALRLYQTSFPTVFDDISQIKK